MHYWIQKVNYVLYSKPLKTVVLLFPGLELTMILIIIDEVKNDFFIHYVTVSTKIRHLLLM